MSKIKNTDELLKRARGHARADHIKQGTYGSIKTNGKVQYEGCAIACLSVLPTQKGLRDYFAKLERKLKGSAYCDEPMYVIGDGWNINSDQHRRDLKREFGIGDRLVYELEWIFEGFGFHGAAIQFIPDFAKALRHVEGIDIRDEDVPHFSSEARLSAPKKAESLFAWFKAVGKAGSARPRKLSGEWSITKMEVV